ncbi:Hexosyltransferase [Fasciola hepatica]|uniref:Hexosyltransferase n=1 Tax=Fasciola hepatica TaxID=6192 RepID=A0A2H1C775_FASHE|nr:Hexosyltransferase [Fasciola hepatica]
MGLHFFILAPNTNQTPHLRKAFSPISESYTVKLRSPEEVLRYKHARWEALNNLDGRMFKANKNLGCESPRSSSNSYRQSARDSRGVFTGTKLFRFPRYVDMPKLLCRFKQGVSIFDDSITDRNFVLLVSPPLLCGYGAKKTIELLILIKSAHVHTNRRMAIRKLWGDDRCWGGRKVRHVFLLGLLNNQTAPRLPQVDREIEIFGDIIQQGFIDHYYNNTYKMLFGIQWAVAFCPEAKWLMFVDDDFFVNPRLVLSFIDSLDPRLQTKLVVGDLAVKAAVLREKSKWSVNKTLFSHRSYPNFVQAGAFFMGAPMAVDLYVGSRFTEFFPFDDVFIGLVLNKLLVAPAHMRGLLMYQPNFRKRLILNGSLALHGIRSAERQKWLWHIARLRDMCRVSK